MVELYCYIPGNEDDEQHYYHVAEYQSLEYCKFHGNGLKLVQLKYSKYLCLIFLLPTFFSINADACSCT